jgi:hypothetical protein
MVAVLVGVKSPPASAILEPSTDAVVYQPFAVYPVRITGVGSKSAEPPTVKLAVRGEIAFPPFVVASYVIV